MTKDLRSESGSWDMLGTPMLKHESCTDLKPVKRDECEECRSAHQPDTEHRPIYGGTKREHSTGVTAHDVADAPHRLDVVL